MTKRPIQAARMVEEQTTTHKWGALMLSKSHAKCIQQPRLHPIKLRKKKGPIEFRDYRSMPGG